MAKKIDADPQGHYGNLAVMEMDVLGRLFEREGFKNRAEESYVSALEYEEQRASSEPGHPHFARSLNPVSLINLYRSEGRLGDAERVLQHVLDIQVASLGERHRAVVDTLTTLAGICEGEGAYQPDKLAQAVSTYERAIAIQESNLGPSDRGLISLLQKYAALLLRLHEDAKAAEVQARLDAISTLQQNTQK